MAMGRFTAKLRVWHPASPSRVEELEVRVDTGTTEGHTMERDLVPGFVAFNGFTGGDNVVVAEPGDVEVMRAHTLESLGVTVDPVGKKLVPRVGLALTAI
jgi:hypothetical protein